MRQRILIVDDEPDWLDEIAEMLMDYEVHKVSTAREARAQIDLIPKGEPIDLVLLDLQLSKAMGIESGLMVLGYLREKGGDIPCIAFSAHDLRPSQTDMLFRKYHIAACLEKPKDMLRLEEEVRQILAPKKGDGEADKSQVYGTGQQWAVLAGVNAYEDVAHYGNLQVCVKDVEAVYKQLIAGGFDSERVHLLTDNTDKLPTRDNILSELQAIANVTEPEDLLLFYYSGHGDEESGEPYLLARNGRRLVLSDTGVSVSRIKNIMNQAAARAKVIILDSCHSGADIGRKGAQPMSADFIRRVFEEAEGMAILASCKQGQVSYEWREQEQSVFTHFLLESLTGKADRDRKGFVTIQDAHRHVVDQVKLWASKNSCSQTPTLQSSIAGDLILCRYKQSP